MVSGRQVRATLGRRVAGITGMIALLTACTRTVPSRSPSHPVPTLPPAASFAMPAVARNGPLTIFGFLGGLRSVSLTSGRVRSLMPCHGSCTLISSASWSRDGRRVVFTALCAGGCASFGDPYHGIRIADPTVGTDALLRAGEDVFDASLSPDGSQIAFIRAALTSTPQLMVMATDGTGTRLVTDLAGAVAGPSWSPDGGWLTYSGLREEADVFVVRADGTQAPVTIAVGDHPAWSPDGTRIAYIHDCRILSTSPDGGSSVTVTTLRRFGDHRCSMQAGPVWSPDGTELAVSVSGGLYVMDADGRHRRRLLRRPPGGFAWQPKASRGEALDPGST